MGDKIFKDFRLFSKDICHLSVVDDVAKKVNNIYAPYILEERPMHTTALDLFSRLLYERIMFVTGEIREEMINVAVAQLLYLDSIGKQNISMYINSCGGDVINGLALIDTMNIVSSEVSTVCLGMAASMGSVILSNGEKGKRYALPHSRIMIHQVSSNIYGTYSDMKIEMEQTELCRKNIYDILAKNTNRSFEEIEKLCDRNNWFIGKDAIELGVVDSIITK